MTGHEEQDVSHNVFSKIEEAGSLFAEQSESGDTSGRLTDEVGKRLKDTGLVRLLQCDDPAMHAVGARGFRW